MQCFYCVQVFYTFHIAGFVGFILFAFMHYQYMWTYTYPGQDTSSLNAVHFCIGCKWLGHVVQEAICETCNRLAVNLGLMMVVSLSQTYAGFDRHTEADFT